MKLSLIVPCYNEEKNLVKLIARFREVIAGREGVELVLVDNGSKDGSAAVLQAELAKPENVFARVVTVTKNRGYGFGIVSGLRSAKGEYLGWTHADLQTDPNDLLVGFDKLLTEPNPERCLLRGRRRGRNPFDAFFTFGMSVISSAALGTWLHDINAQPKLFHRSFWATLDNPPDDFSLDLYLLYRAKQAGMKAVVLPVDFAKRTAGEAKGGGTLRGKIKLIKRTWAYIFALKNELKRPTTPPAEPLRRAA
jgi:glycosyltransferase involved in cell wall biosynthesis